MIYYQFIKLHIYIAIALQVLFNLLPFLHFFCSVLASQYIQVYRIPHVPSQSLMFLIEQLYCQYVHRLSVEQKLIVFRRSLHCSFIFTISILPLSIVHPYCTITSSSMSIHIITLHSCNNVFFTSLFVYVMGGGINKFKKYRIEL